MSYNFSTLNDKEFELIIKDLLNAKFKLGLQSFKAGRDKGIDLRYSTANNNNSIVVQAKHYINSEFAQLKHILLSHEINNVKVLNPDRYIVVTSLPLSAQQKDELKNGLSPYIRSANDVIGQEDLNGFLNEFKEIEKANFKLWFSSVNILNSVLNNAVESRSKYLLQEIRKKVPFYVITPKLNDALAILQKEKLLLITGQPGIGKTTLAEIILFERALKGIKVYKVEDIREAEDIISIDDEEKQIFYFDDFLGANYYEIVHANKTESQLTSFVERLKNTPNKYLILTTRTVILNHATEKFEKINRLKNANQQFEIKLGDYKKVEKALILYNHLYFREVNANLYDRLLNEKFYRQIIDHKNYTPRIIEFITDKNRIKNMSPDDYHQFILNNLNNPKEIWRYSFNNQIEYLDRCLLLTLFTLDSSSFKLQLMTAFEKRLEFEKREHNQIIAADQFDSSLKLLLNGFISSTIFTTTPPVHQFQFINPSLTDFLIAHVADSFPERKSIISSIKYVEQLNRFGSDKSAIPLEKELQMVIRDGIAKSEIIIYESFKKDFSDNKGHAIFLETLCKYCPDVNVDILTLKHFKQLSFDGPWYSILRKMLYVLENLGDAPQTIYYIKENFITIVEQLMRSIDDELDASTIPALFERYKFDFTEYVNTASGNENIIYLIEAVLKSNEKTFQQERRDEVRDMDDVELIYDDLDEIKRSLVYNLLADVYFDYDFGLDIDKEYWKYKIAENIEFEEQSQPENDDYDYHRDIAFDRMDEDTIIDDLFDSRNNFKLNI